MLFQCNWSSLLRNECDIDLVIGFLLKVTGLFIFFISFFWIIVCLIKKRNIDHYIWPIIGLLIGFSLYMIITTTIHDPLAIDGRSYNE